MLSFKRQVVSWSLVFVMTIGASGCATTTTLISPTHEAVASHVREGDNVELVMKSGEKRQVQVTGIRADELRAGYDGGIAYGEIAQVKVIRKSGALDAGDGDVNLANMDMGKCGVGDFYGLMAVVGVVGVVWFVSKLARVANHW